MHVGCVLGELLFQKVILTFLSFFLYFLPFFRADITDKAGLLSKRKGQAKLTRYLYKYTATTKPRPSKRIVCKKVCRRRPQR